MRNRKKKNGAKRLVNLSSLLCDDFNKIWNGEEFYENLPFRLEIGCGKGDFISKLSKRDETYNYIAVERVSDVALLAIENYARSRNLGDLSPNGGWLAPDSKIYDGEKWNIPLEGRGNARFAIGDAEEILHLIPDSAIESIYTNFSDPWKKKGYARNRLTNPRYLKEYFRVLKPGGAINLKTDNDALFEYSLETLNENGFEIAFSTYDLHSSEIKDKNIETEYERNFVSQGIKIKALIAVVKK